MVAFLATYAWAEESKLDTRWRTSFPAGVGAFDTGDLDGDKNEEIAIGDYDNIIHILDVNGTVKREFSLPPTEEVGSVYTLKITDLNRDGVPEILVGLGGRKESINHTWDEYFNSANQTVGRYGRFLYRSNANAGELRVLNTSGGLLWRVPNLLSINDVKAFDINYDGKLEVIVGTGSYTKEEYWEFGGFDVDKKEMWELVEYNLWNASAIVVNSSGARLWSFDLSAETPNKIRAVDASDFIGDAGVEVLVGSDDGILYLLNDTGGINMTYNASNGIYAMGVYDINLTRRKEVILGVGDNTIHAIDSDFNLLWKNKISDIPQVIYATDIEGDKRNDIFAGGRDCYIYLLYENGALRWKHFVGEPVYYLKAEDIDGDEFVEVISASNENLTVFDFNKQYIRKEMGEVYYLRGYERYQVGDYVLARIYVQKARELFLDSNDLTTLPKIDLLLDQVKVALKAARQTEAEFNYGRALEFYGKNKYDESKTYLLKAKTIYLELNNTVGVDKADLLLRQIDDEIRLRKSLKADALYADALSYYGFRNFTAARQYAEDAKAIYAEVKDEKNAGKVDEFIVKIGDEYVDSARRSLIGLDVPTARDNTAKAKEIYLQYNSTKGLEKVFAIELEIKNFSERKPNPIYSQLTRMLPYFLVVLILVLVYSFIIKRKAYVAPSKEKSISASIQKELEEMA